MLSIQDCELINEYLFAVVLYGVAMSVALVLSSFFGSLFGAAVSLSQAVDENMIFIFAGIGCFACVLALINNKTSKPALAYIAHKTMTAAIAGFGVLAGVVFGLGFTGVALGELAYESGSSLASVGVGTGGVALSLILLIRIAEGRDSGVVGTVFMFTVALIQIGFPFAQLRLNITVPLCLVFIILYSACAAWVFYQLNGNRD